LRGDTRQATDAAHQTRKQHRAESVHLCPPRSVIADFAHLVRSANRLALLARRVYTYESRPTSSTSECPLCSSRP
jgi:hypothetical protein